MQERVRTSWMRRIFSSWECWSNITSGSNQSNWWSTIILHSISCKKLISWQHPTCNEQNDWMWTYELNKKWGWGTVAEHRCNSRYLSEERDLINLSSGLEQTLIVVLTWERVFGSIYYKDFFKKIVKSIHDKISSKIFYTFFVEYYWSLVNTL